MSSPETLIKATVFMFISFIVSIFVAFMLGMIEPRITDGFINVGMLNIVHPEWSSQTTVTNLRSLMYLIPYLISGMGIVYFLVAVVKRQKYDQYGNEINNIDMRW